MAKLERVLGCTAISRSSISVDENRGVIAYPAGATVILHNPRSNAQAHLIGSTKNFITCLAFSKCGKYIVTGESGHEPRIRVWELYGAQGQFAFTQVADIKYHQLGISCVRFASDDQVVSVGNQYDKTIVVWNWRSQQKIAENRLTSKVNAMDITDQGSYVTVGIRHVKFWHLSEKLAGCKSLPLQGRSAILADQRNNTFLDVCCAPNSRTFSITETSLLVEFHDKKLVSTFDLQGEIPCSLALGSNELFVGFINGTVRSLDVNTLKRKMTYCKPHYLTCDVAQGTTSEALSPDTHPNGCKYPGVRALCYHKKTGMLSVVYSDRSIYTWQEKNEKILKISSQLFHVGPVNTLEIYPLGCSCLPAGSFLSGGVDETVRIWNIDHKLKTFDEQDSNATLPQTNVYSDELKKIIFIVNNDAQLTETPDEVLRASLADTSNGVKTLKVSPDGRHLACGGRDGNLCIFDLTIPEMKMIAFFEAHESDIMCLVYSDPQSPRYLLASGSRDRVVHLFDPANGYEPLTSVDDHTSTINSILFVQDAGELQLITAAADRTIIVRKMTESEPTSVSFARCNQITSQFGLNCLASGSDGSVIAACQDRQLRSYSLQGKLVKQIKGASGEDGQLTKIRLDPSRAYAATVCTDRCVYVVDVSSGETLAVLAGQSENVTDVAFSADCRRLYVASYSGCIFVWRLSNSLYNKMISKLKKTRIGKGVGAASERTSERSETPDSLIGSGSDAAGDDHLSHLRFAKMKDSESEFGSLSSLRIGDEDSDSCIIQKPAAVACSPGTTADSNDDFELKRLTTEVVRRSSGNLMSEQIASWDVASPSNNFTEGGLQSNTRDETSGDGMTFDGRIQGGGPSNIYTTSRSMSNIRAAMTPTNMKVDSPRRPRKKWDMAADAASFVSPLTSSQQQLPSRPTTLIPNAQPLISKDNVLGGFMTMNGTHIQYSPRSSQRLDSKLLVSSNSALALSDLQRHMVRSSYKTIGARSDRYGTARVVPSDPQQLPQSSYSAFSRNNIERCSLTKKLKGNGQDESITVWSPPSVGNKRSNNNMQYTTPGKSPSSVARRKEDYASSDLHLRSRSQSPSQLALNGKIGEHSSDKRQRQDSDMSTYSTVTMTSTRMTPSSSRTNLRMSGISKQQSSIALNKLNEARDRLRKSQENLSGPIGDDGNGSSSSNMLRSKSIGNLRFSAATPLSGHRFHLGADAAGTFSSPGASASNGETLLRSRLLARSVGSLHSDTFADKPLTQFEPKSVRNLARTIEGLKKASNSDLSHFGLQDLGETLLGTENDVDSYATNLLSRNQRGKGAVQKRVERYQPRNRISRDTTSGESDSNSSDVYSSPLLQAGKLSGQQSAARRYFAPASSSNRSVSCVEAMPRVGVIQTRRMFEQQRHNTSNTPRRVPNYLAQKLASGDIVGPDMGSEECPRQATPSNEVVALHDFDGRTYQSKQMAKHIAECLEQFNTGLDKVLQARQLLESSQDLPVDDRETMLRLLNQAMRTSRKRLECTDDRYDPDGRHSDSPSSLPGQRQGASLTSPNQQSTNASFHTSNVDAAEFFQQHGPQLLALLQQNMAKQN